MQVGGVFFKSLFVYVGFLLLLFLFFVFALSDTVGVAEEQTGVHVYLLKEIMVVLEIV